MKSIERIELQRFEGIIEKKIKRKTYINPYYIILKNSLISYRLYFDFFENEKEYTGN